jgi:hypothetical protein
MSTQTMDSDAVAHRQCEVIGLYRLNQGSLYIYTMSTRDRGLRLGLLLVLACLAALLAGCGDGSSSSPSSSSSKPSSSAPASESEVGSGTEPSAQFLRKNSKNTIVKFGEEASAEEREAASAVITESYEAREAADFEAQCQTLSKKALKKIPKAKDKQACPAALKKYAEPLSATKEARKNTLSGPIAALRVKGKSGYALYHGNDGSDYALAVEKEAGAWKVAVLVAGHI